MYEKKSTEQLMALLTACACGMAILCFFLPMVTVDFLGSWSSNGFDLIEEYGDDTYAMIIPLACSVLGVLFALLASKNRKVLIVNIILSLVAMVYIFGMYMYEVEDSFGEAGVGFYAFVIMHLAAIVMSIVALTRPTGEIVNKVVPAKKVCPKCGKTVGEEQLFCDSCGTDLRKKPEPPKENRCKACGKVIDKDVAFCRFCGASTKDLPVPPTPPEPPVPPMPSTPHVRPVPSSDKVKRTAICPHCGAKQMEGTVICKYCGTSMQ